MKFSEGINMQSLSHSFFQAYLKLIDLGFDFEKNSAMDLINCIVFIIKNTELDNYFEM